MAGTWLKIRHDLEDAPEIRRIARAAGLDRDAVLGKLVRVWSWFDRHASADGRIPGAELEDLDDKANAAGFGAAMAAAGWLEADAAGLALPNWERHNGEGAKERALKAERMRRARAGEPDDLEAGERGAPVALGAPPPAQPRGARAAAGGAGHAGKGAAGGAGRAAAGGREHAAEPLEGAAGGPEPVPAGAETGADPGENADCDPVARRAPRERHGRGAPSATREDKRRGEESSGFPPPPPPPRARGEDTATAYAALLAAWEPMAAAGHVKPWRSPRPPAELADRLADPDWLGLALEAIARLPGCRYFRTPARLDQLCGPAFAERVLAGKYDDLAAPRPGAAAEAPRTPPERRRYFRAEFQRSMTDAEYRHAMSERKATA
jgi:hypothetical protein